MNSAELKAAIKNLPLSPSERKTALVLAGAANPSHLIFAALLAIPAAAWLLIGWEGVVFACQASPGRYMFPADKAWSIARLVAFFFLGCIQMVIAINHILLYWSARRTHRLMQALIANVKRDQCGGPSL